MLIHKLPLITPRFGVTVSGIPSAEPPCLRERLCVCVCVMRVHVCVCVCVAHTQALGDRIFSLMMYLAHKLGITLVREGKHA